MNKLTRQEEEVMLHIWDLEPCFVKDVLAKFAEPRPPYTTVASIFKNIERKGYIKPTRYGNIYQYKALISKDEYKSDFMKIFTKNYFGDSYKEMITFFAKENSISTEELKEIIAEIEKGQE